MSGRKPLRCFGMGAVGYRRDARCWVSSGCQLLGSVGMQLAGFRAEGFCVVVRCWVSSGCAQLGFVGMRAARFRRLMQAAGVRWDEGCCASSGYELDGFDVSWRVSSGIALLGSVGCDLVRFVGLLAAEFCRGAGQRVSIIAAVFRLAVCWVSSGCRLPGFVGMQARGCRRIGSCQVLSGYELLNYVGT